MSSNLPIFATRWPEIFDGMSLTIILWLSATCLAMILGFLLATLRLYAPNPVSYIIRLYVTIFRGTPLLIQLFIIYYGGPSAGLTLTPIQAGVVGLTVYGSAQFIEIFRAGYESLPNGQIEAAKLSGLKTMQIVRHIQVPQIMVTILPSLKNMFIIMTKETAILSVIAIPDLTAVLNGIGSETYAYAQTLAFLAAFYWILLELIMLGGNWCEERFGYYLNR